MLNLIKKIFSNSKKDEIPHITYKSASSLGKDTTLDIIPTLDIPQNNKKNILVMDDNSEAAEITVSDFKFIFSISRKLKDSGVNDLTPKQQEFVGRLPNNLFTQLSNLDTENYNLIIASTDMAAFSVFQSIDSGVIFHYSVLDILIGGYNKYGNKFQILDGIDVAYKLERKNQNSKYLFYSGCSLVEDSEETIKFFRLFHNSVDFNKLVVMKDRDLYGKRLKLLELLGS